MSRYNDQDECKIYVGDLPRYASERDLEEEFNYYGPLRSVWVARSPAGFGFVEYKDSRDADDAVRDMDGRKFLGAHIRVEHSRSRSRRYRCDSGGSSGRGFSYSDRCYECGQCGHYAYDCRKSRRNQYDSRSRSPSYERNRYNRDLSRSRSRSYDRYQEHNRYSRGSSRDDDRSRSRSRDRS